MNQLLPSLTVIAVVNKTLATPDSFTSLSRVLEKQVATFDFVLVANGVDTEVGLQLKELVQSEPDTTVVFLNENVHDDLARLVGIEHAVGDYVLFCDPAEHDAAAIPAILRPLEDGYDVVVATIPELVVERGHVSRLLFEIYLFTYRHMTGVEIERSPSGLRVLSRAAALFVASRPNGELLLRSHNIGSGFPATEVAVSRAGTLVRHAWTGARDWSRGLSLLLGVSTMPLRVAAYISMFGGAVSVLYAVYVLTIFLFKPNVAAGWTTISLQLAALMFIFSLLFLFLTEYIIQIHAANPPRSRRQMVLRELRSPRSRRGLRLNVIDTEGRFQLGAPPELLAEADRAKP